MAVPATLDLTGKRALYAGDRYQLQVTFTDPAGDPIDKSASTWLAQIRRTRTSTTAVAAFEVDDGQAADGVILLALPAGDVTTDLDGCVWDLQETSAEVTKLAGVVEVVGDVSR